MDSEEIPQTEVFAEPLVPHSYPAWVYVSCMLLMVSFTNFIWQLPVYYNLHTEIRSAEEAFREKDYCVAIQRFHELKKKFPESKKFRLRCAQAYFVEGFHYNGLQEVKGVTLSSQEWQELCEYMPQEYQKYFETVER